MQTSGDTQRNLTTVDILDEYGIDVTPVFITIDPERDTVKTLNDYVETSHEKLIGLTGSLEQVQKASKAYRTFFRKNGNGDDCVHAYEAMLSPGSVSADALASSVTDAAAATD